MEKNQAAISPYGLFKPDSAPFDKDVATDTKYNPAYKRNETGDLVPPHYRQEKYEGHCYCNKNTAFDGL